VSLVGGLQQGGGILSATYDHCAYTGTFFPGNLMDAAAPGMHVLDVADPADPVHTTTLNEPAMLGGTWESLKVNTTRKLLAATAVPVTTGTAYFSIYDISDCAHPVLLNPGPGTNLTMPLPFLSHEGGFSPRRQHLLDIQHRPRTAHRHRRQRSRQPARHLARPAVADRARIRHQPGRQPDVRRYILPAVDDSTPPRRSGHGAGRIQHRIGRRGHPAGAAAGERTR
jgi:hypothetical protein